MDTEAGMEFFFDTREDASLAAAARIRDAVAHRLRYQPEASLVVSGGSSPARCFEALADTDLDWANVHVLLSDERWVPPGDDASNEGFVRRTLLQRNAASARLLPVYAGDSDPARRCDEFDTEIRTLPFPFACSLLGMGEDGHFASLFPDADTLDQALDHESPDLCVVVNSAASPHVRLSLTLSAMSRSDEIVLLMFGEAKRAVYERAKASGNTYPVAHLLKQKRAPVRVYWAP
jgi:6-phosphogluconolactonase